jgi:BCD family chlorophyll transporter-like MFS transporter
MGLWGAAQAVAFGLGGLVGTAASDLAHWLIGSTGAAYAAVFAFEAVLFVVAARLAASIEIATRVEATAPVRQWPKPYAAGAEALLQTRQGT